MLGRAILDSIPIIKFGEPGRETDVEMAARTKGGDAGDASSDIDAGERAPDVPTKDETTGVAAEPAADEEVPECSICMERLQRGDRVRVLPGCQHAFHPDCLDPWLLNVSSTCPLWCVPPVPLRCHPD